MKMSGILSLVYGLRFTVHRRRFVFFSLLVTLYSLLLFPGCARKPPEVKRLPAFARLTYVKGGVIVIRAGRGFPGTDTTALSELDVVETGPKARAEVAFDSLTFARLDEDTRVRLDSLYLDRDSGSRRVHLNLVTGEALSRVGTLASKSTYEIESPTAVMAVRGTKFLVGVDKAQETKVVVLEGKVGVRRPKRKEPEVLLPFKTKLRIGKGTIELKPEALVPKDLEDLEKKWKSWEDERKLLKKGLGALGIEAPILQNKKVEDALQKGKEAQKILKGLGVGEEKKKKKP
jgi:hypothetical protein